MQAVVALGFGVFFAASLAIGLRLLWLARRNRGRPELLIGLSILGIGPAGFALMVFAVLFGPGRPGLSLALLAGAQLAIGVGSVCAYAFNWTVFRRADAWARVLVFSAAALFAGIVVGRLASGSYTLPVHMDIWSHLSSANMVVCMFWGSFESLRYYGMMRRRARLGLADPVLTNRFLLWGLGIGSAGVGTLIGNVAMFVRGTYMQELDGVTLSNSLFGLAAAVFMWVAFLPPHAYRRWIESRARLAAARA